MEGLQSPVIMSDEDAESDGEDFVLAAPEEQANVNTQNVVVPEL